MTKENSKSNTLSQIIATVVIALLVGGTSPWWWKEFFGGSVGNPEKLVQPIHPANREILKSKVKKYLMDQQPSRVIIITDLGRNEFRMEEPSSPWPWEGTATIDGGQLIGDAKFRNSLATMKVEGVVRSDESIVIKYKFITSGDGKSSAGRVDNHVWYLAN